MEATKSLCRNQRLDTPPDNAAHTRIALLPLSRQTLDNGDPGAARARDRQNRLFAILSVIEGLCSSSANPCHLISRHQRTCALGIPTADSYQKLDDILSQTDGLVVCDWAYGHPCQIQRLASAVTEGLKLWPYTLRILQKLCT